MNNVIAGTVAVLLLLLALGLIATLQYYRHRREEERAAHRALGRRIIAEIPTENQLIVFSEDASRFFYGKRAIEKGEIRAVRLFINGEAIASHEASPGASATSAAEHQPVSRPVESFRDRWDVSIVTPSEVILIECGAIRERVSQELARQIYDTVRRSLQPA